MLNRVMLILPHVFAGWPRLLHHEREGRPTECDIVAVRG